MRRSNLVGYVALFHSILCLLAPSFVAASATFPIIRTDSMVPVHIKVGSTYFSIPEAYFIYQHEKTPRVEESGIPIHYCMPGFKPVGLVVKENGTKTEYHEDAKSNNCIRNVIRAYDIKQSRSSGDCEDDIRHCRISHPGKRINDDVYGSGFDEPEIKKALQKMMSKQKPEGWDELIALTHSLQMSPQYRESRKECRSIPSNCRFPEPVPDEIVMKGMNHSNSAIRAKAKFLKENEENFKQIRKKQKEYFRNTSDKISPLD